MLLSFLIFFGCAEPEKRTVWKNAEVLEDKLDHPWIVTFDDKNIYFITGGTLASLQAGTSGVWKMPLTGGEKTQLFKGVQKDAQTIILPDTYFLATDDKFVYWSSGKIWRTPIAGGESQEIASGAPTEYALDEEKVYWQNFAGEGAPPAPIYSVDKNGGAATALTEPLVASGMVVDKDFLYWAQSDGIYKMPKNGGNKTKIYVAPGRLQLNGLIADAENFYFTQGDGKNALMKVSKTGGDAAQIAPEINHAYKFDADETHIYFVKNESSQTISLNKVSKNGGEVLKLGEGYLKNFAVGKDKIFVTDTTTIYALGK